MDLNGRPGKAATLPSGGHSPHYTLLLGVGFSPFPHLSSAWAVPASFLPDPVLPQHFTQLLADRIKF